LRSVFIHTLGCPKNEYDSELYGGLFRKAGWRLAASPASADLLLVNTCAFIAPAVEESLEAVRAALAWKDAAPGRRLVLAGCLPGRFPDDGSGGLDDFELVTGPSATGELAAWLGVNTPDAGLARPGRRPFRYIRIADGCSNMCSYCTIPLIRGTFSPSTRDEILRRSDDLASQGALEIGLVAQDTGSWRDGGLGLPDLASELARRHPGIWFRLHYLHPLHIPRGLFDLFSEYSNIMPYIDIPLQHASGRILERMNRRYGRARLEALAALIERCPVELAVRATVMTGYPGEDESDFGELASFLERLPGLRTLVAFRYHAEEGTAEHARSGGEADDGDLAGRFGILGDIGERAQERWGMRLSGRTIEVIADSGRGGHSRYDAPLVDGGCIFDAPVKPGRIVRALVTGWAGPDLFVSPGGAEGIDKP
jgi:ribosomal protein S12 methylthiotransferase